MQKYQLQTTKTLAILQWNDAFEYSDVYDALEELARMVTDPVPLLVIDNSTEFDASSDELHQMIYLLERYKEHFTNRVAYVVSKDVYYGFGHMAHIFSLQIGVDLVPFRGMSEARGWLSELPP